MAALKFYKVDASGKITRLRRECPTCGAGVFMAAHFDRQYCGKCGLTHVFSPEEMAAHAAQAKASSASKAAAAADKPAEAAPAAAAGGKKGKKK